MPMHVLDRGSKRMYQMLSYWNLVSISTLKRSSFDIYSSFFYLDENCLWMENRFKLENNSVSVEHRWRPILEY